MNDDLVVTVLCDPFYFQPNRHCNCRSCNQTSGNAF